MMRWLTALLLLIAGAAKAQVPCPGGVITNCPSPTYYNLTVGNIASLPGGYVTPSNLTALMGPAQGAVLGIWPNLYFPTSPAFTGTPTITNGSVTQLELIRQNGVNGGYTFVGATPTSVGISSSEALPLVFANNSYTTRIYVDPTFGNVGIGTTTPGARLDVVGQTIILEQSYTPPTSSTACTAGAMAWDATYFYTCVATNTWKRIAWTTF